MIDKCRICGEYMFLSFGNHRCGPSYQVVIIGNDDPPSAPFELRAQLSVRRVFSYDMNDAVQTAVAHYHDRALEYSDNTTVGAMTWEQWQQWESEHEDDDDALVDPAMLTWYDVALRMEPTYLAHQLSRPSADGGA